MLTTLKAQLLLKRTILWMLALAGLSAGLCFVPLFNLLSYEFCLALAVAGSVAAAHLGSVFVACARARDDGLVLALGDPPRALGTLLARGLVTNLLLLAAPLVIICLNALRVKNCDLLEGLAFFVIMPALSVVLATATGTLWGLLVARPALATLASLLTLLASAAWGFWRFYDSPAIFAYDPYVGYFPGTLYDEAVAIRAPFLFYRLYNLAWLAGASLCAALLLDTMDLRLRLEGLAGRVRARRRVAGAALLCLVAGGALFAYGGPLGFVVDGAQVRKELGGVRHTRHFTIYHAEEMKADEVDLLAQDHEFRHAQLQRLFGSAPPRITSYIFRDHEEKRRLMGAGRTFIAKPWRGEVYMQHYDFPHPVLKHELAHVFAGLHGDRVFGISLRWRWSPVPHPLFNVGLIEGIAVATDWRPFGELTGHQAAAVLVRSGLAPPARSLFGAGFMTHAARRSYTMAGSFCRHLARVHGMGKLEQVFRSGGDFEGVYDRSLRELLRGWSRWLERVKVPAGQVQLARERFLRPSILRRVCGHEVANRISSAEQLAGRDEHEEAAGIMEQVCRFDPSDPAHPMRRLGYLAAAGKLKTALALAPRILSHPSLSKPKERQVMTLTGDLHWLDDNIGAARTWYGRAASGSAGAFGRRVLYLKRWALARDGDVRRLVMQYLVTTPGSPREGARDVYLAYELQRALGKMEGKMEKQRSGLGLYLVGKQLAARGHCADAVVPLARSLDLGLPGLDFTAEALRTLARCQYIKADHAGAGATLEKLLNLGGLPAGALLHARAWQERNRWRVSGKLPAAATLPVITPLIPASSQTRAPGSHD